MEQFQAYQMELQRRYAIFVNSVKFASFVTSNLPIGGVDLKSVLVVNDALVVNNDVQTESDIVGYDLEYAGDQAIGALLVTAPKIIRAAT